MFKPPIDAGAELSHWDITDSASAASARSTVDSPIRKDKTKLQNQVELDEGKDIRRDGSWFNSEGHKANMQTLQKKIEEATMTEQAELLAELEEERHKTQAQKLRYKILTSLAPVA